MTLRVILQIIPFGDEDKVRTIETINISNMGESDDYKGYYQYIVEHNKYKQWNKDTLRVEHKREDGAIRLAGSALMALDDFGTS